MSETLTRGEKIMRAVTADAQSMISRGVYLNEARMIARTYKAAGCTEIIDLGCSTGVLGLRMIQQTNPSRYVAIDANPYCVDHANMLLEQEVPKTPKEFHKYTIMPSYIDPNTKVRGAIQSLIHTSSLFTVSDQTIEFDTPALHVDNVVNYIRPTSFVKIDVEGVDLDIVVSFLNQNLLPPAFQFEVQESQLNDVSIVNILRELRDRGYKVPSIDDVRGCVFSTINTSKTLGSVINAKRWPQKTMEGYRRIASTEFEVEAWEVRDVQPWELRR